MFALERHSALGRFIHDDSTNRFAFGLRPPCTHTHCCSLLGVFRSTKMFLEPKEYMWWSDTHFLPPWCYLGHTLRAYVLFCALMLPLFDALCASKNRTHKFMRPVLYPIGLISKQKVMLCSFSSSKLGYFIP
jgi:hypothetical protein